ncbi:hypothetical protein pdam_00017987 [Pocillopora damicornis]|uniref:Uncharacterized protein n=1 Tax=Pocillopora damicornis TaxID=46731 RepID=A0A3M6V3B4_POCDA|nr:hypothetical protein pdam_00017987 [Pocillopora damicornis]
MTRVFRPREDWRRVKEKFDGSLELINARLLADLFSARVAQGFILSRLEFKEYIITRSQKDGSVYKYAVRAADDNDAPPRIFHLEGGDERKDPLKEYRMLEIVTRADGNKVFITGIRNGGDCVVKI